MFCEKQVINCIYGGGGNLKRNSQILIVVVFQVMILSE